VKRSDQDVRAVKAKSGRFPDERKQGEDLITQETYQRVRRGSIEPLGSFKYGEGLHKN
jgi:hypothetical protein